ncbi:sigma-70 region 4 domain-containing protein [Pollutimonas bauzanensis]|uniref:Sigma-70, region 4 n=1 Tax=Pollutimonas bauzanensis TaxID=658167 RepID=A0A1M5QAT1_9BURK|nr:sigma-70 region 4 domain-containing protein [Pollutimonas bauzanensis]SHH10849.1 Sigma-70, region 4 [Pollutimonas bauzanensis]
MGRSVLSLLIRAIECLPRQRRAIFLAARVEQLSAQEVACRYGVTPAKVRNELRKAHAYCEQELLHAHAGAS